MRTTVLRALLLLLVLAAAPVLADQIELENGDKIEVTIIEETEDTLIVEHPQLGRMTVPRSALKPPEPIDPGLFGTKFMEGWKRSVGFGFGGASGNSSDASINASLDFSRDAETFRGVFDAGYFYSTQNGVKTTNSFAAGYQHDFLFSESKWFLFGRGRYQFDEFQPWENRISASAGVGYDFLEHKDYDLRGELGAGVAWISNTFLNATFIPTPPFGLLTYQSRWTPEGVVGLSGSWRPFKGHEFTAGVTYFPDLMDWPEFRLLSAAAYQIAISPIDGLSLKFGMQDEYNSKTDTSARVPGSNTIPPRLQQKNNLKYFGNLVYEF
jgi:putative salt-induced outer membrane protein YdiY